MRGWQKNMTKLGVTANGLTQSNGPATPVVWFYFHSKLLMKVSAECINGTFDGGFKQEDMQLQKKEGELELIPLK